MPPSKTLSPSPSPSPSPSTSTESSGEQDERSQFLEEALEALGKPLESLPAIARGFETVYHNLALHSTSQFFPTPIRRLPDGREKGRVLAMDLGGTNLRVGVVELFGEDVGRREQKRFRIALQGSWEIPDYLKSGAAEVLFAWVAERIVNVLEKWFGGMEMEVMEKVKAQGVEMGVTFSFPMEQSSHTSALLMPMGKGFTFSTTNDLSVLLKTAYDSIRLSTYSLPELKIVAITNDSISTLLSAAYVHNSSSPNSIRSRAAAGIIAGTGTNATVLCPAWKLSESKKSILKSSNDETATILLNTEWSINGTAPALKPYITPWDRILDEENEKPGFQPFEEMVGGRYLGELVRLVAVEEFSQGEDSHAVLPEKLKIPYGIDTRICGDVEAVDGDEEVLHILRKELGDTDTWKWGISKARIFKLISIAVSTRAAALVAAATIGVLGVNDELGLSPVTYSPSIPIFENRRDDQEHSYTRREKDEQIIVCYTGTILEKYPLFRERTQGFMDVVVERWREEIRSRHGVLSGKGKGRKRVLLVEAKDGGIVGAAVLAGMVRAGLT